VSNSLAELAALGDPARAAAMAAYHKAPRAYLGVETPRIADCVARWREGRDLPGRVALARQLWDSDIFEARIAAAKLLTQARMAEGEALVWTEFLRWSKDFDSWAIADAACKAGERRLMAEPARLDAIEAWVGAPGFWLRRAALVVTLPWTKQNHPGPEDLRVRERVLGWAGMLVADREWFVQKAIGWWLRSLSVRDPDRVRAFLDGPGRGLRPFARREALRRLG
jgi:3-methyladenine DNA glycosylase AlkD